MYYGCNTTWNGSSNNLICLSQTLLLGLQLLRIVYWTSCLDELVTIAGNNKLDLQFETFFREADLKILP